jgi:hypothetical protein
MFGKVSTMHGNQIDRLDPALDAIVLANAVDRGSRRETLGGPFWFPITLQILALVKGRGRLCSSLVGPACIRFASRLLRSRREGVVVEHLVDEDRHE